MGAEEKEADTEAHPLAEAEGVGKGVAVCKRVPDADSELKKEAVTLREAREKEADADGESLGLSEAPVGVRLPRMSVREPDALCVRDREFTGDALTEGEPLALALADARGDAEEELLSVMEFVNERVAAAEAERVSPDAVGDDEELGHARMEGVGIPARVTIVDAL